MMDKLILGGFLLATIATTHWYAYESGEAACERKVKAAVETQAKQDAAAVANQTKAEIKREVRYVEKIVRVSQVVDNCMEQRLPADIIDVLGGVHAGGGGTSP